MMAAVAVTATGRPSGLAVVEAGAIAARAPAIHGANVRVTTLPLGGDIILGMENSPSAQDWRRMLRGAGWPLEGRRFGRARVIPRVTGGPSQSI